MNTLHQNIQKKDIVELVALLAASIATIITVTLCSYIFIPMVILCFYFLFILVYLITQLPKYTVINDNGKISIGMFVFAILAKIFVLPVMFGWILSSQFESGSLQLKITIPWSTLILIAYFITIICKKQYREIFNTAIYFIPIIIAFFFL